MNLYQQFIAKSKYARYLNDKKRREHWPETVARYFKFMREHLEEKQNYILSKELEKELHDAVLNLEVMPSMRLLMTAGEAAKRSNICCFNCAFVPIDDQKAFDELMLILMNGTGIGFSVESFHVTKLPEVPDRLFDSNTTIEVKDSKESWAKSLRQLVALLYSGEIPKWDTSKVRKKGEPLMTFGGRASGPEPLEDLFRFVIRIFKQAVGRKLTTQECHDICCKIAEIVIVGSVRRSALISGSDLSDIRMRTAKVGEWYVINPQRALSNNSAVYREKPEIGQFMDEWKSLYDSKSGERSIFNHVAIKKQVEKNFRRKYSEMMFTNPCCLDGDTLINTTEGPAKIKDLHHKPFTAVVSGKEFTATGSWISGEAEVFKLETKAGYEIDLTKEHLVLTSNREWVEAQNLTPEDDIVISSNSSRTWIGEGSYGEGYLLGSFLGDGNFSQNKAKTCLFGQVKLWDHDLDLNQKAFMEQEASKLKHRSDWKGFCKAKNATYSVMTIGKLPQAYDIQYGDKFINSRIEQASSDFQRGIISGYFDADGHIEGSYKKGFRLGLSSTSIRNLKAVQRMLLRQGVFSKIFFGKKAGVGIQGYTTKDLFRLHISGKNIKRFYENFEFNHTRKQETLKSIVETVDFYDKPYETKFVKLTSLGKRTVWDATVSKVHAFDANGIVVHNSEIILNPNQFCNLSTVIIKPEDKRDDLIRKVRLAAILGTFQASLTYFPYLRKSWKQITEKEALLGVSLCGILDNEITNDYNDDNLPYLLDILKSAAVDTNREYAAAIGINQAAAVTCVKPEGTTSQLCNVSSGIHGQHSRYYIRTIRSDIKDPVTQFLKDAGVPNEPCNLKPNDTVIFSFPKKAPDTAILREDLSAVEHLKLWLVYQRYYCEHKPSVTISVKENEWLDVAAWVYKNWDEMTGVSFLPYDLGTYTQAPYQEITEEEYTEMLSKMPTEFNWDELIEYRDSVEGVQNLACSSGFCEI